MSMYKTSVQDHEDHADDALREENFDVYYKKVIGMQDRLERIRLVSEALEERYVEYQETREFVHFLRNVEEVFAHADAEKWSVEKTEEGVIKSEIYLLSQISGIEEEVFYAIYEEFVRASHNVEKIQLIAQELLKKYAHEDDVVHQECRNFVMFVRDVVLMFARTMKGDVTIDQIDEAKTQIIHLRMETMAADNIPPLHVLQKIYHEFLEEINK